MVCYNPAQARRDAAAREAIVASLRTKLQSGDKALVGNDGYRRFLATPRKGISRSMRRASPRMPASTACTCCAPTASCRCCRLRWHIGSLWRVEAIFRTAKSILETRPIFHQSDAAIAGHLFCSFLALVLRKELDERLAAAGVNAEWGDIVRDLDRVEELTVEQGPKRFVLRAQAPGCAGAVFKAVGVALPPLVRQVPAGTPPPQPAAAATPPRRRGRPRRGATLL